MEPNRLFVYGILKRGFELDLREHGGIFLAEGFIKGAVLHEIGGGVGLRMVEDPLEVAFGELFKIPTENRLDGGPDRIWTWLDYIEQNRRNYERKIATVSIMRTREDWLLSNFDIPFEEYMALPENHVKAWVYSHIYYAAHGGYDQFPIINGGKYGRNQDGD